MKHRIVTAAQMKEIERAGDAHGLPYLQMMENAGLAAYAELQKQLPHPGRLLVVCGKGSSGGDGTAGCLACWYGERDVHDLVQLFPVYPGIWDEGILLDVLQNQVPVDLTGRFLSASRPFPGKLSAFAINHLDNFTQS